MRYLCCSSSNIVDGGLGHPAANVGRRKDPLDGGDEGKNQDARDGEEPADEEDARDHTDSWSGDGRGSMNDGNQEGTGDGVHGRRGKKAGEEASAWDDDEEESTE